MLRGTLGSHTLIPRKWPKLFPRWKRTKGKDCRIKVVLKAVEYRGADIGSNWRLVAVAHGGVWDSGAITFAHHSALSLNVTVADVTESGGCGRTHMVDIAAIGIEGGKDRGQWVFAVPIRCTPAEETVNVTGVVGVEDSQTGAIAVLLFHFSVTAKCK